MAGTKKAASKKTTAKKAAPKKAVARKRAPAKKKAAPQKAAPVAVAPPVVEAPPAPPAPALTERVIGTIPTESGVIAISDAWAIDKKWSKKRELARRVVLDIKGENVDNYAQSFGTGQVETLSDGTKRLHCTTFPQAGLCAESIAKLDAQSGTVTETDFYSLDSSFAIAKEAARGQGAGVATSHESHQFFGVEGKSSLQLVGVYDSAGNLVELKLRLQG
jgi:hypothetical protein